MLFLEHPYTLRRSDFDQYGRILPSSILDLFQEIAIKQSESDQTGPQDLFDLGAFWVVTRMKFEMLSQPRPSQEVLVATWPHSPTRLTIRRDFKITDTSGVVLVRGTSEWILLNTKERKVANIADFYNVEREFYPDRSLDEKLKKLPDFEIGPLQPFAVKPGYCDIDMNGHVNNTKYANYVLDALAPGSEGCLISMQIDYHREVMCSEDLMVYTMVEQGIALAKGIKDIDTTAFVAQIEFE